MSKFDKMNRKEKRSARRGRRKEEEVFCDYFIHELQYEFEWQLQLTGCHHDARSALAKGIQDAPCATGTMALCPPPWRKGTRTRAYRIKHSRHTFGPRPARHISGCLPVNAPLPLLEGGSSHRKYCW